MENHKEIYTNVLEQKNNSPEDVPSFHVEEPDSQDVIQKEIKDIEHDIGARASLLKETQDTLRSMSADLGVDGSTLDSPVIHAYTHDISVLESKRVALEQKLNELLSSDVSEKYKDLIEDVRQSKIDWAHSEELARRLKLKGATNEDVQQVRDWLVDNAREAKTFVLPSAIFHDVVLVLREMTGHENVEEASAFHVSGGMGNVPDHIKNSIFLRESPPIPIPSQAEASLGENPRIITELHHEFGHVTQDGLLESELYSDWNPVFKEGAPDPEYMGLIHETDTRIRSMFRDISELFDPRTDEFGEKEIQTLKEKLRQGTLSRDTIDLISHYDDSVLIDLARNMPAI